MSSIALKIKAPTGHLQASTQDRPRTCGCFNCLTIFQATEVVGFTGAQSALKCPKCGQDTVLDGTLIPSLDQLLLTEVNGYWFAKK